MPQINLVVEEMCYILTLMDMNVFSLSLYVCVAIYVLNYVIVISVLRNIIHLFSLKSSFSEDIGIIFLSKFLLLTKMLILYYQFTIMVL